MFSIKTSISCFALLNVFIQIKSLVELSNGEDNYIAPAEAAIEHTMDELFNIFNITQEVKHKPRLKQYSTINDFFSSITLTDCNNLKEIAKMTRVNNIDNNTQHFIAQINEVLNEDDKSYESNDINNNYVSKHIDMFIRKLQYLKEMYVANRNSILNADLLKYPDDEGISLLNVTLLSNFSKPLNSDENEFWQPSGRRIYQGVRTTIKKFPFMASVLFFKRFQCAGSIIKDDLVITSASCLQLAWNNRYFRENPAFLSVQIGSDTYEGGGDNIGVIEIHFYPEYNPKTLRNNLALLRLGRKINFRNQNRRRIKKIDIDRNPWPMPAQCPKITVVGWGAKDRQNVIRDVFANRLSYAELDYYALPNCQDLYSKDYVTEKNFCAGFLSRGGGACNRDAGGPGVIDNTLYGIVSFGSPICGASDAPTVFTKLGFYVDWIETIMEKTVPSKYKLTTTPSTTTMFDIDYDIMPTKTSLKIFPLMTPSVNKPASIVKVDHPDEVTRDPDLQIFLRSMFSNHEIEEYFNKPDEETQDRQALGMNDDTKELKHQFIHKPKQDTNTKATQSINIRKTMPKNSHINLMDSSDDTEFGMEINIDNVTEPKKEIKASENVNKDKTIMEGDIMTLIDKLDIDDILKPMIPEQSQREGETETTLDTEHKEKEKESSKILPSKSDENHVYFGHRPEAVLNYLFFSKDENDKNKQAVVKGTELSKQINRIKNITLKDELNNTDKHDKLSEQSIYEMVSLAIEEEAKRDGNEKNKTL